MLSVLQFKAKHLKLLELAQLALPLLAAIAIGLSGCSPQDSDDEKTPAVIPTLPYDAIAAHATGFTVGAIINSNAVYVLFDPQCPHCGHLWEATQPLHGKLKFVWIPVAFINAKSGPQGAVLLSAADPETLMAEHEKSILAGAGGVSAIAAAPLAINKAIKKNTRLFNSLGAESVPYILGKNLRTGQLVTHTGALSTAALAELLGVN